MNIHKIHSIINETIKEFAYKTKHYDKRVGDRLMNKEYSNFHMENENIKNKILNNIKFVEDLKFPRGIDIGILAGVGSINYEYYKENPNNPRDFEDSIGQYVWMVIRDNAITTIFFRETDTSPSDVKYVFDVETLKHYVQEDKDGDMVLTHQDIGMLSWVQYKSGSSDDKS